jgi:hypothetical protein
MAEQSSSALAMLTACLSAEPMEATARRRGVVQRPSNMTGTLLLTRITCGSWSDAKTTVAPWAATATPLGTPVVGSPEAVYQRRHQRARTVLRELIRTAWATRQSGAQVCDERLLAPLARVHLAESTGVGLPDRLTDTCPGAGGSAAPAGAKMPRGWDDQQRVCTHVALRPWKIPDQQEVDTVGA